MRVPIAVLTASVGAVGLALAGSVGFVRLAARGRTYSAADVPRRPTALVLGAQVYPNGRPSSFLAARLDLALRLWQDGRVQKLLLSGDGAAPEYDEPAAMRDYLLERGIPQDVLVTDGSGLDTYDSCWRALRIHRDDRLTVVTQSYHLPRALATARALGIDAVGVGDRTVSRSGRPWLRGVLRDQLACVKTVVDLVTRRSPTAPTAPTARHAS